MFFPTVQDDIVRNNWNKDNNPTSQIRCAFPLLSVIDLLDDHEKNHDAGKGSKL